MNAIFLGSFDPPHKGHHNIVKTVNDHRKDLGINRIHVIPSKQNPNKSQSTGFVQRYIMTHHMMQDLTPYVLIDDIENEVHHKYTYELINYIKTKDIIIGKDFLWIITVETYKELLNNEWKESKRLLSENKFLIVYDSTEQNFIDSIIDNENIQVLRMNESINVHSTDIRNNIEGHKNFLNESTYEYIKENRIYL